MPALIEPLFMFYRNSASLVVQLLNPDLSCQSTRGTARNGDYFLYHEACQLIFSGTLSLSIDIIAGMQLVVGVAGRCHVMEV